MSTPPEPTEAADQAGQTVPDGTTMEELRALARATAARAHAPYSRLHIGAAGRTADGHVATGCNVEASSYGLTLCAECGLISDLVSHGWGPLVEVSIVDDTGTHRMPCGRCRQLLHEFGDESLVIDTAHGPLPIAALLPYAFGPDDLPDD